MDCTRYPAWLLSPSFSKGEVLSFCNFSLHKNGISKTNGSSWVKKLVLHLAFSQISENLLISIDEKDPS
jgi:hypothetical protein